ncbi:MAG: magnesium/cobalt transporter CorA, partial [Proteobacteria bacterium]
TDALLESTFGLHPLVIEDIWGDRSLPKIEDFDGYLYVLVHGVASTARFDELRLLELDIVFGKNFVITYHQGSRSIAAVKDELSRSPRMLKKGPVWVVHALLDHLVDHYMPVIEAMDDAIAKLEDDVVEHAGTPQGKPVMARIFQLKKSLHAIRRVSMLQREILLRLSRGEFDEIPAEAVPFFRDVYDHFASVTNLTESYRELVSGALEAFLSVQSNRMNEVMKTLTLMSTVMLPLTFIAGVYGMNFNHMPELGWVYGYPFALALMGLVAAGILAFFRRKRWI